MTRRILLIVVALLCTRTVAQMPLRGPGALSYLTFGVRVALPAGWERTTRDTPGQIFIFASLNTQRRARAMMMLDVARAIDPSLNKIAESFAKAFGGQVSPNPVTLGGVAAMQVDVPDRPDAQGPIPRRAVLCVHEDGTLNVLMLSSQPGVTLTDDDFAAFETVRSSVQFVAPMPAIDAIESRPWAMAPLPGAADVLLGVPEDSCLETSPGPNPKLTVSVFDPRGPHHEFLVTATAGELPSDDLLAVRDNFGHQLNATAKVTPTVTWSPVGTDGTRWLSNATSPPVGPPSPTSDGREVLWALIRIDARRFLLLNFMVPDDDDAATKARRENLARKMAESVRLAPPAR